MDTNIFREPSQEGLNSENRRCNKEREDRTLWDESSKEGEWAERFKSELIAKFSQWLEKQPLHTIIRCSSSSSHTSDKMSLFTLFSELSALKQETKIANRQFKAGMDQCEKISVTAQQAAEVLKRVQSQDGTEMPHQKVFPIRSLLLGILDIRDRMERGISIAQKINSPFHVRLMGANKGKDELIEGQKMTLRNLDRLLASFGVVPIDAVGKNFDPYMMRAVEVEERPTMANRRVIEEIRKGFFLNEEVLRLAEVKVNRIE